MISSLAPSLASAGFGCDIDDGVRLADGRTYLFKGDQYVRLDPLTLAADAGYPVKISDGWIGFPSAFGANDFDAVWINPNHP
ncbi:hemopexin repeat-containing protein [Streptomyces sp. NPDC021100]|uniref:hemopexin repeat-containing protein n=1 Tax=Streptomyces sp. NPDC021100 TaxID=3365114 RepID=UPI0037902B7E